MGRREFKSNAYTAIALAAGFSLCNVAWHVLFSWLIVGQAR